MGKPHVSIRLWHCGYCVVLMSHQGALLLAADQTPLAERDLLNLVLSTYCKRPLMPRELVCWW